MPQIFACSANTKTSKSLLSSIASQAQRVFIAGLLSIFLFSGITGSHITQAQSLQQQINNLNAQTSKKKAELNVLDIEASGFEEALATIKAQIRAVTNEIRAHEVKRDKIIVQIKKNETELVHQKKILGKNIRAMYLEGDISTIEMLATSKDLGDYLDKQQYRDVLQEEINQTMARINAIKAKLTEQKATQDKLIAEQRDMEKQLQAQKTEQARLLKMNAAQQARLDGQLQANSGRIAELRRQQAAENARLFANSSGGSTRVDVPDSTGYPWANVQPFPNSYPDPWGMYKRQCVSYTAWKVYHDGKRMPYWGGRGNAKNWANNARAEGIPVYYSPKRGDIAVSTRGTYGHVMYVEEVYGNGTMRISQYNASWTGRYSEAVVSTSGLEYVRFP
ncbi:MAG: CHAP domain-containing protein [bacterium]|nr:CHAP domain-containing protein [bacterium]